MRLPRTSLLQAALLKQPPRTRDVDTVAGAAAASAHMWSSPSHQAYLANAAVAIGEDYAVGDVGGAVRRNAQRPYSAEQMNAIVALLKRWPEKSKQRVVSSAMRRDATATV